MTKLLQRLTSTRKMSPTIALAMLACAMGVSAGFVDAQTVQARSYTVLYTFQGGSDGDAPVGGLLRDESGNLYGTAAKCGSSNKGTIFKVGRVEKFTLLHSFGGHPSDGTRPRDGYLIMDESGNLYGATVYGGAHGRGALYKLSRNGTFTVLHSFAGGGSDGCNPDGAVLRDRAAIRMGA